MFSLLLFIIVGVWWITIYIVLLLLIYNFHRFILKEIRNGFLKKIYSITYWSFYITVIFYISKSFIADIYCVSDNYMNDTLYKNDVILVNKLSYRPVFPIFFTKIVASFNAKQATLTGLKEVKQGDILMIEEPENNSFFSLRCVGLPGDLLEISDGKILANNNYYSEPKHIKEFYTFQVNNKKSFYDKIDFLDIKLKRSRNKRLGAYISRYNIEFLKNDIEQLNKELIFFSNETRLFPKSMYKSLIYGWTLDNYGPILIPEEGMKIELDEYNFMIYEDILKLHEGVKIEKNKNGIYQNGKRIMSYTFKKDYYFLIGDNRKNSYDSRSFGFLPKNKIVGRVSCILFSNNGETFQWDRVFKII